MVQWWWAFLGFGGSFGGQIKNADCFDYLAVRCSDVGNSITGRGGVRGGLYVWERIQCTASTDGIAARQHHSRSFPRLKALWVRLCGATWA